MDNLEADSTNPRRKFKTLKDKVSLPTLDAIKGMGFKKMTDIQAEVLPEALDGFDVVATAKTGSGKTLAFLIPSVEVVIKYLEQHMSGNYFHIIFVRKKVLANLVIFLLLN